MIIAISVTQNSNPTASWPNFFSGINLLSNLTNLAVVFLGGYFVFRGQITVGGVMVGFLLYVSMFLQPIRRISILVETYQRGGWPASIVLWRRWR